MNLGYREFGMDVLVLPPVNSQMRSTTLKSPIAIDLGFVF